VADLATDLQRPRLAADALEIPCLRRVAGLSGARTAVVTKRPYRAPHQTISDVGPVGGGQVPRPGEVSLAHHGILFFDELPGFPRHVLEILRQPPPARYRPASPS
jgi:magnesium chelatase family protein